MDDIVKREDAQKQKVNENCDETWDNLPARQLNKLYREKPNNRIKWTK